MSIFNIFKSKEKRRQAEKYRIGMEKKLGKGGFFSRLKKILTSYDEITEELFDELEEILLWQI